MSDPPKRYLVSLDESLYGLDESEASFFKSQTGIRDDEELKKHIIAVQSKAFEIYPYPCIRRFAFTKLKISRLPAYEDCIKLSKERQDAILLDIGCCFGNDARKAVADGWPMQNVIASDLRQGFWDLGHELFRSNPQTCSIAFVPGDAFDTAFLDPSALSGGKEPQGSPPSLSGLQTLTPLIGRVSAIHASSFFHLFTKDQQLQLARAVGSLLSSEPGSVIFGSHRGSDPPGRRDDTTDVWCHSPSSWGELWDEEIFPKGTVQVDGFLRESPRPDLASSVQLLIWSVKRL